MALLPDDKGPPSRQKIIVADEEADFCRLMQLFCMRNGYWAMIATDIRGLLEAVQAHQPHYLLTGYAFFDGWPDAYEELRSLAPQMEILFFEEGSIRTIFPGLMK